MSYFRKVDLGPSFQPFRTFHEQFGFVPQLFRAQTLVPRLIEAESAVIFAILFSERTLSRAQKECVLLALAAARDNAYSVTLHFQMLNLLGVTEQRLDRIVADFQRADLTPQNTALLRLALKLGTGNPSLSREDLTEASSPGLTDEALLEVILTAALSRLLCALSIGVGAVPDFVSRRTVPRSQPGYSNRSHLTDNGLGFHLRAPDLNPDDFLPFVFLREQFGSVPGVFRAQTLRPDVLEAEAIAIRSLLGSEGALPRRQMACILLPRKLSHDLTGLDRALVGFAETLAGGSTESLPVAIQRLREHGFTEEQILEAVVAVAFQCFFSVLEVGLGVVPEFGPRLTSHPVEPKNEAKKAHLSSPEYRPTDIALLSDPDADCVARVQGGDLDSFEELMNRHSQRIYRTLVGMLGNPDEARDAMQDTFLKAFQHLASFERRSKFSTWLVSIAIHTGIQRLRDRRPMESLDETGSEEERFRPRQVQAWTDDPERLYSRAEMRALIESGVMRLPAKYRLVLMLRDIEQLPIEDAASALGLGIPAIKARLLRGRLMLREALAPHFISPEPKGSAKGAAI